MVGQRIIAAWIVGFTLLLSCAEEKQDEQAGEEIPVSGGVISSGGGRAISSRAIAAAPTDIALSSRSANILNISWTDAASNELIYEIEMCTGVDCENFEAVARSPLPADSVTHSESGLLPSTAYRFHVRTTNRNGSSAWLTSENIWTELDPNTSLTLTEASPTTLSIAWTPTSSTHNSVAIERCEGTECEDFRPLFGSPFSAPLSAKTEAGLSVNTVYRFRVKAISETSESAWLTSSDFSTLVSAAPPSNAAVSSITDTTATFSWSDNSTSELIYEVERCQGSGCTTFSSVAGSPLAANSTSYQATGLTPSTFYKFRVRITAATGSSSWLESS